MVKTQYRLFCFRFRFLWLLGRFLSKDENYRWFPEDNFSCSSMGYPGVIHVSQRLVDSHRCPAES